MKFNGISIFYNILPYKMHIAIAKHYHFAKTYEKFIIDFFISMVRNIPESSTPKDKT